MKIEAAFDDDTMIYIDRRTQLFEVPQALKLRCINHGQTDGTHVHVPMDLIYKRYQLHDHSRVSISTPGRLDVDIC